jgi:hypothetical protein
MPAFFRRSQSVVATDGTDAAIAIAGGGAAHASSAY